MNKKYLLGLLIFLFSFTFQGIGVAKCPSCPECRPHPLKQEFSAEKFLEIRRELDGYLVETPLIPLPTLSEMCGKKVFLKDESKQKGNSFKTRGVTYEVFKVVEEKIYKNPKLLKPGIQLVTQTDGNHGIALITAICSAIEKYSAEYPKLAKHIRKIEPVIFTYKTILPLKREEMDKAMARYRKLVGAENRGQIHDNYVDYADARTGREHFIAASQGRASYMEHGGRKTMQGHGVAAMEILDQLQEQGIGKDKRICILLPVGAGGPIGLAAALKAFRPYDLAAMVQTLRFDAFNRSFRSGKIEYNDGTLSPYTVEIDDNGVMKQVTYEDGIGVDAPESEEALAIALLYLDDALLADAPRALHLAPYLLKDVDSYYSSKEGIIGGTTAITADAMLFNSDADCIRTADVLVLFGTEGSIDPAIARYTRKLLEEINSKE